jgi:hypothetical protein
MHSICVGPIYEYIPDALFLIQVYFGLKFCPSVLEVAGLRVPARYIRDFACSMSAPHVKLVPPLHVQQLLMCFAGTLTRPSATCAAAANVVCRDADSSLRYMCSSC